MAESLEGRSCNWPEESRPFSDGTGKLEVVTVGVAFTPFETRNDVIMRLAARAVT